MLSHLQRAYNNNANFKNENLIYDRTLELVYFFMIVVYYNHISNKRFMSYCHLKIKKKKMD